MTEAAATGPARELRARQEMPASPARVWAVLTDLRRMPGWSPELVRMVPLKPGGLRPGQWYLGVNRRGAVVWPTRTVVSGLEHERLLAWDTPTSGARWVYELAPTPEGTLVTLTRPVPRRLTLASRVAAGLLLGGAEGHADELEEGMRTTLARLASAVREQPRDARGSGGRSG